MTPPANTYRVLIIGAGVAGLTAARLLRSAAVDQPPGTRPIDVQVVDKAKGPGGRLATRRIGHAVLDHGAQFFTVRSDRFRAEVDRWLADGVVEEWCRGFGPTVGDESDGHPRYRGAGGMNRLGKYLAEDLPVVPRHRASAIVAGSDRWAVTYETDRDPDEADAVIATPPVPQTIELLRNGATFPGGELAERLESIRYHKVIGVLERLDRSPGLVGPGALQRPDDPVATFAVDNQAKGISDEPALTVHLAHGLSEELWDASDDEVLRTVADELVRLRGPASPLETQVKRWRYAAPMAPTDEPLLTVADEPGLLVLAGDAFGGSKVEGAFLSGVAAAEAILADVAHRTNELG